MTSRDRMLLALVGFTSAAFTAGCGGGGGGSVSPGPTPSPTIAPVNVASRPLGSGDTFAYAGTTTKTFVYSGVSPEPQSSTVSTVTQAIKISGPTTYNGATVFDVNDAETDASSLQTTGITTDSFDALIANGSTTNLVTYGFTTSDSLGDTLTVTLPNVGSGNGLLDELPETKGTAWSNGPAETATETETGGESSSRVVAADGTYVDTTNFPLSSIYPTSAPVASQAVIAQNADGSGSYTFDYAPGNGGPQQTYLTIAVSTPRPASSGQPALVPIVATQPSTSPQEVDVPLWYPQPLPLYAETDVNGGAVAIPASCNTVATFGKTANAVVQTITQYDTIVGTKETFSQTDYVVPTYGLACAILSESLQFYYDYSGQSGLGAGPTVDVSATQTFPIETETIATTLGLTASNAQGSSVARGTAGLRVANARATMEAFVEREKLRHKTLLFERAVRSISQRHVR